MAFILLISTMMLTSMSIVKERESGTIEQLIVTPIRPLELVIGKTMPFAIIGFMDVVLVTAVSYSWFKIPPCRKSFDPVCSHGACTFLQL